MKETVAVYCDTDDTAQSMWSFLLSQTSSLGGLVKYDRNIRAIETNTHIFFVYVRGI